MDPGEQGQADARLEDALARRGLRDPRPRLRSRLRELRDTPVFADLVRRYEEELVPGVAAGELDPVEAWMDFARRFPEAAGGGREVAVDPTGRAAPASSPLPDDRLILFLPEADRQRVLPLRVPAELSAAQSATLDLLVEGRLTL